MRQSRDFNVTADGNFDMVAGETQNGSSRTQPQKL